MDRGGDCFETRPELAGRAAPGPRERNVVADHLAHHVGRSFGDFRRMRYDDDADRAHQPAPNSSQIATIISADDRAPGSTWPIERSPRKEARPRVARIGAVASAAASASALRAV